MRVLFCTEILPGGLSSAGAGAAGGRVLAPATRGTISHGVLTR